MSRGNGPFQRQILERVRRAQLTTLESLRWELWDESHPPPRSIAVVTETKLRASFNNRVRRAVEGLVSRKEITAEKRELASTAECLTYYPDRTLNVGARLLRQTLLPAVFEWTDDRRGPAPQYNASENEQFKLRQLSPETRRDLEQRWTRVEPKLAKSLGSLSRADRQCIFLLYAKGAAIFGSHDVDCRGAFRSHVAESERILPADLYREVRQLANALLDDQEAAALRFKSLIRTLVDIPNYGSRCTLSKRTIEFLEQARPDVLHDLPGYQPVPPPRRRGGYEFACIDREPTQSRFLHRLFDHKVFQEFTFLRAA